MAWYTLLPVPLALSQFLLLVYVDIMLCVLTIVLFNGVPGQYIPLTYDCEVVTTTVK